MLPRAGGLHLPVCLLSARLRFQLTICTLASWRDFPGTDGLRRRRLQQPRSRPEQVCSRKGVLAGEETVFARPYSPAIPFLFSLSLPLPLSFHRFTCSTAIQITWDTSMVNPNFPVNE